MWKYETVLVKVSLHGESEQTYLSAQTFPLCLKDQDQNRMVFSGTFLDRSQSWILIFFKLSEKLV